VENIIVNNVETIIIPAIKIKTTQIIFLPKLIVLLSLINIYADIIPANNKKY